MVVLRLDDLDFSVGGFALRSGKVIEALGPVAGPLIESFEDSAFLGVDSFLGDAAAAVVLIDAEGVGVTMGAFSLLLEVPAAAGAAWAEASAFSNCLLVSLIADGFEAPCAFGSVDCSDWGFVWGLA